MSPAPSLSIVVPVLNEAALITTALTHFRTVAPQAELIVVDGGSGDETIALARPLADKVLITPPGRARQMNAGAAVARGSVLWFVHVDLKLPQHSASLIENALRDPKIIGGCFRLRFPCRQLIYRVSDSTGNLGVEVFGFALGDHGIFCRRHAFEQTGGYPEVPILEDAEIYKRLRRTGRMRQLCQEVTCSPRTYQKFGPWPTTAIYFVILTLYVCRVPISFLERIHKWFRKETGLLRTGGNNPIAKR